MKTEKTTNDRKKVELDKESSLTGFGLNKARFAVANVIKFLTRDCWDTLFALKPYSSLKKKEKARITKKQYKDNTAFAIATLSELFEACKAEYEWVLKKIKNFFYVVDLQGSELLKCVYVMRYRKVIHEKKHIIKITLKRFQIELNKKIEEYIND